MPGFTIIYDVGLSALDTHPGMSLVFHKNLLIFSEFIYLFVVLCPWHPTLFFFIALYFLPNTFFQKISLRTQISGLLLFWPIAFDSGCLHEHGLGYSLDPGELPEITSLKNITSSNISLFFSAW